MCPAHPSVRARQHPLGRIRGDVAAELDRGAAVSAQPSASGWDVGQRPISGRATLLFASHNITSACHPRFEGIAPYVYGHLRLEEGPIVQAIVLCVQPTPQDLQRLFARGAMRGAPARSRRAPVLRRHGPVDALRVVIAFAATRQPFRLRTDRCGAPRNAVEDGLRNVAALVLTWVDFQVSSCLQDIFSAMTPSSARIAVQLHWSSARQNPHHCVSDQMQLVTAYHFPNGRSH